MNKKYDEFHLYTDGTYNHIKQEGGISCVLYRSANPEPVFFMRKTIPCGSPTEAEYAALELGLTIAFQRGFMNGEVFCDSAGIVSKVNSPKIKTKKGQEQRKKIQNMLKAVNAGLQWVPRTENYVADAHTSLSDTRMSKPFDNTLKLFHLT